MNIYSWAEEITILGEEEKRETSIVVAHIISLHVGRVSWDTSDKLPYALNIFTKEKCWSRFFETYVEAKIQYDNLQCKILNE